MDPSVATADVSVRPNESIVYEVETIVGSIDLQTSEDRSVVAVFAIVSDIVVAATASLVAR